MDDNFKDTFIGIVGLILMLTTIALLVRGLASGNALFCCAAGLFAIALCEGC